MTKEDVGRIEFVANQFLEMVKWLGDKKIDLSGIQLDEELMKYILSDRFCLENQKIKSEMCLQMGILDECKDRLKKQYPDLYCPENLIKVRALGNYYFIKIGESPYEIVEFIFDKNGNYFTEVSSSQGSIDVIDENNFFLVKKEESSDKEFAVHFRVVDNEFKIINSFYNVCSGVLPVLDKKSNVKFGNLVSWSTITNGVVRAEKSVLYNYKRAAIVVPEYTSAKYDYGKFPDLFRDGLIRIINRIGDEDKFIDLEFLIDEDGILATDVMDFQNNIRYSIEERWTEQEDSLNSIFCEANKKLIEKNAVKKRERKNGS